MLAGTIKIRKLLRTSVSLLTFGCFYGWVVVGHQLCQMNVVRSFAEMTSS